MGQNPGKEGHADEVAELIKEKQFLDYYDVGDRIGEGSFGVVYKCCPKGETGLELAVKMVDKVETPADKIREEAEFLRTMNHENIIKCHDVINEKCFVCIVMDIIRGGDLIVCMQLYWKQGKIPYNCTLGLAFQMASSLAYLHTNCIIHRDVKADNYLCDRQNIGDPEVRIILTDFGTAKRIEAAQRLKEKTGTKLYWSPEFYALNYSFPVDVWAMGVVVYGLISGSFPFKNKTEVHNKPLKWSKSVPADVKAFALGLLNRDESKRTTAPSILELPVLESHARARRASMSADSLEKEEKDEEMSQDFREQGANCAIKDRREELLERMVLTHEKTQKAKATRKLKRRTTHTVISMEKSGGLDREDDLDGLSKIHYLNTDFRIMDRRAHNSVFKYEWWTRDRVDRTMEDAGHFDSVGHSALGSASPIDESGLRSNQGAVAVVGQMLRDHEIDYTQFGKGEAKTLEQLTTEIQGGAAVLMLDAANYKKLVRVVEFVGVRLSRTGADGQKEFLVETRERFADGRERDTMRLPGTKKEPYENCKYAAERITKTLCNLEGKVELMYDDTYYFERELMSPSYPGVFTVYKSEVMEGEIVSDVSLPTEWAHVDPLGVTKHFKFMNEEECRSRGVRIEAPENRAESSALIEAPLGFDEEELTKFLETHKVDVSMFGTGHAASLTEFAGEIQKGDSSLMIDSSNDTVIRVVDVVLIKLSSLDGSKVLVQTERQLEDGTVMKLDRLPGTKRRPDENQFLTAKKILKRQLQIAENHVQINSTDVILTEAEHESVNYPGLRTVYQKRIISAQLVCR